jgi:hypothetical protein
MLATPSPIFRAAGRATGKATTPECYPTNSVSQGTIGIARPQHANACGNRQPGAFLYSAVDKTAAQAGSASNLCSRNERPALHRAIQALSLQNRLSGRIAKLRGKVGGLVQRHFPTQCHSRQSRAAVAPPVGVLLNVATPPSCRSRRRGADVTVGNAPSSPRIVADMAAIFNCPLSGGVESGYRCRGKCSLEDRLPTQLWG